MTEEDPTLGELPYVCDNCGTYISDSEPCVFVRRIVLCSRCAKSNPLLGFEWNAKMKRQLAKIYYHGREIKKSIRIYWNSKGSVKLMTDQLWLSWCQVSSDANHEVLLW